MRTKQLLLCALFAALTAAGGFIKIPFPGVMMVTLQTFIVFLAGILLTPKYALISQLVYMAIGLLGLPVFSKGGGLGYVLEPSFGFVPGFALCALLISLLIRQKLMKPVRPALALKVGLFGILSMTAMYTVGIVHMYLILNLYMGTPASVGQVILIYNAPFFLIDAVKFLLALLLGRAVLKRLPETLHIKK